MERHKTPMDRAYPLNPATIALVPKVFTNVRKFLGREGQNFICNIFDTSPTDKPLTLEEIADNLKCRDYRKQSTLKQYARAALYYLELEGARTGEPQVRRVGNKWAF